MAAIRIMYVCTICAEENPEGCGHYDRKDLAVMPNGDWLCDCCWDDLPGSDKDDRRFSDFPRPPEYGPKPPAVEAV